MNIFDIIPNDLFKVLTSKYKEIYYDCLMIVYSSFDSELSYGTEKDVVLFNLEKYFDENQKQIIFDEESSNENIITSSAKAHAVLKKFKETGWIEYEFISTTTEKINMPSYASSLMMSFTKIIKNETIPYHSFISQIHSSLLPNEMFLKRPYEYVLLRVFSTIEEMIATLKKMNTDIKKRVDEITKNKSVDEIFNHMDYYNSSLGDNYHNLKTRDNISYFKSEIINNLYPFVEDEDIFNRCVEEYMQIEGVEDENEAREYLNLKIYSIISVMRSGIEDILREIDNKNTRYFRSATERASYLMATSSNIEGKINSVLRELVLFLNEGTVDDFTEIKSIQGLVNLFPQGFLDESSLSSGRAQRAIKNPEELENWCLTKEEREEMLLKSAEYAATRFSKRNIIEFVNKITEGENYRLASTIPINSKRDFIRLICIKIYGEEKNNKYTIRELDQEIIRSNYQFYDFVIERSKNEDN